MKIKKIIAGFNIALILSVVLCVKLQAQVPPTSLNGESLRTWLKENYYNGKHNQLGYTTARKYMYNYIDNHNNKITCVYSGYQKDWSYGGTGSNPTPINCEHTVPQSFFNKNEPMRSDIHHLFPTHQKWNSTRSNYPYNDIKDNLTSKWMISDAYQTSTPRSSVNLYSEFRNYEFEPREDHKGNCARAIFYFYTMYPTEAGEMNKVGDIDVLYQWHLNDPVDSKELARNDAIETYQGDRNPYIDYPGMVGRAWGYSNNSNRGSAVELFISEYTEGSRNNKAIEIANYTGKSVDLSAYSIKKQVNGAGNWSAGLALSGMLSDGQVCVVVNSNATSSLLNYADVSTSSSVLAFNGNDPIALFKGSVLKDVVGTFNSSKTFGQDVTKIRNSLVSSPSSTYNVNEWTNFSRDDFRDIGKHKFDRTNTDNVLIYSSFDSGLGLWQDGGANSALSTTEVNAVQGKNSVKIQPINSDVSEINQSLTTTIYPLPAANFINVNYTTLLAEKSSIEIYSIQGKLKLRKELSTEAGNSSTTIDVRALESGVYVLKINNEAHFVVQNIMVQ